MNSQYLHAQILALRAQMQALDLALSVLETHLQHLSENKQPEPAEVLTCPRCAIVIDPSTAYHAMGHAGDQYVCQCGYRGPAISSLQ